MAVTIRDVAKYAEVSIATVSRAFSAPELVAEGTRARVIDAARQLGYQPARTTRSHRPGRTGLIAAVVPDVTNPFFQGALKGVQAAAREAGYQVLLADTAEDPAIEQQVVMAVGRQVDGLILLSPRLSTRQLRDLPESCPTVLFNRMVPGFAAVLLDSGDGIRQVVRHLAALGHRRCAYAGGPRQSFADAERRRSLVELGQRSGMQIVDLGAFRPQPSAGARVADMAVKTGASAVIAYNDLVALGVIERLRDRRVQIPREISVTGFDDIPMASMSTPKLTTVALPLEEAGRAVLGMLHHAMDKGDRPPPRGRRLPVRLVVRSSTATHQHSRTR